MITGSVASSLQGEPRSTHDIDLVVAIERTDAKKMIKAFPLPDFYLDEESVIDAINRQGMFNLIDVNSGDKVDFWTLTNEPFDQSRFARRYAEELGGMRLTVSRPEDTILAKLRWAKLSGGSEKQFIDALRVYEVQLKELDMDYLHSWAKKIGVTSILQRLQEEAEVL
ncbi:hypothetical protein BIY37_04315 [Candidatus Brocadia sapporoensis]|uniref:Uncharacterized protein n=2 Tax=Candidatus Brocadia sapporoensis TaxID=392547 RepID=A0A1V6M1F5_9BACT|nr:hypothetical protein BIY37_04315 [Candidatus Brocadia sapporoensis]